MTGKKISELNGIWSLLLRVLLAVHTVVLVPFGLWVRSTTVSIHDLQKESALANRSWEEFAKIGPRYTSVDASRDQALQRAEVNVRLSELSGDIELLAAKLERIAEDVADVKKNVAE